MPISFDLLKQLADQSTGSNFFGPTPTVGQWFQNQQQAPQQAPMPEERVRRERVRDPNAPQYVQDYTPEEYTQAWQNGQQVTPQGQAYGGQQARSQMSLADATRRNRAMDAADARAFQQNNQQPFMPANPYEFAAWQQQQITSPFQLLAQNQLGSFLNYGNQLNQAYNSPTGPYGQLQLAAAATAPSRASRDVARTDANANIIRSLIEGDTARDVADLRFGPQREIASKILDALGGGGVSPFQLAQEDRKSDRKGSLKKYKAPQSQ